MSCQVTMENAVNNQIHVSQAVPMFSPLTWKLTGDIGKFIIRTKLNLNLIMFLITESNQFEVRQNAADDNSPVDCSPECPQVLTLFYTSCVKKIERKFPHIFSNLKKTNFRKSMFMTINMLDQTHLTITMSIKVSTHIMLS